MWLLAFVRPSVFETVAILLALLIIVLRNYLKTVYIGWLVLLNTPPSVRSLRWGFLSWLNLGAFLQIPPQGPGWERGCRLVTLLYSGNALGSSSV